MRLKRSELLQAFKFIIPGILFYSVLNMFFKSFGFSTNAVFLLFLVAASSAFWITNYQYLPIILGVLLALGSVSFLLTLGQGDFQEYFIIFASGLFVVTMIGLYRFFTPEGERGKAENINQTIIEMFVVLLLSSAISGVYDTPSQEMILVIFIGIYVARIGISYFLPTKEEHPRESRAKFVDTGFNLNQTIVLFSLFFLSSGIYGIYSITNLRPWQMTLIMFAGIYLSSYYLIRINFIKSQELELHLDYLKNRSFNFYSFLIALVMVELVWVMVFLPINPLTFGAIILIIFFSYWDIVRNYLRNGLTRRKFLVAISFAVIASSIILSTSKLYIN